MSSKSMVRVTPPCLVCGKRSQLTVESEAFYQWRNGTLIQDAFPELSFNERELLMTGTHSLCWKRLEEK